MKLPLEKLSELDHEIFVGHGSDNPHNAADEIYGWLHRRIGSFDYSDHNDRCDLMCLEAQIAMLWRLSSYFCNVITHREDAQEWRRKALEFFDRETANRGDGSDVVDWRRNIIRNFDRLESVLLPRDAQ